MLIRDFTRLVAAVCPLLVLGYVLLGFLDAGSVVREKAVHWTNGDNAAASQVTNVGAAPSAWESDTAQFPQNEVDIDAVAAANGAAAHSIPLPQEPQPPQLAPLAPVDASPSTALPLQTHHEIFSVSKIDGSYFPIAFGTHTAFNPNIIPHPHIQDHYIIVAQLGKDQDSHDGVFHELVCTASFQLDGSMACIAPPTTLPVKPTEGHLCAGDLAYFNLNVGPHDMRVFNGPDDTAYAMYGSQSAHTCFGMWVQDFHELVEDYSATPSSDTQQQQQQLRIFTDAVELQRPSPYSNIEKNWFLFWDAMGQVYVHHDIYPHRVFAQAMLDGSIGPDLAPLSADHDAACMAKRLPSLQKIQTENGMTKEESIHQATNSLSLTLCNRTSPSCTPDDNNTFILTIIHHKSYSSFHSIYEPYVVLFQRNAPFALHAISSKPLWIHGRNMLTKESHSQKWEGMEDQLPKGHSEMFYVTSLNWRDKGRGYHGFLDDVVMLGFGVEDSRTAGMDVLAGSLVEALSFCDDGDGGDGKSANTLGESLQV
jgi:hypothetical protein